MDAHRLHRDQHDGIGRSVVEAAARRGCGTCNLFWDHGRAGRASDRSLGSNPFGTRRGPRKGNCHAGCAGFRRIPHSCPAVHRNGARFSGHQLDRRRLGGAHHRAEGGQSTGAGVRPPRTPEQRRSPQPRNSRADPPSPPDRSHRPCPGRSRFRHLLSRHRFGRRHSRIRQRGLSHRHSDRFLPDRRETAITVPLCPHRRGRQNRLQPRRV